MSIVTESIRYTHNGKEFEGHLAYDDAMSGPRPLVTVSHAWGGRGAFENDKAEQLAKLGYAGFAIDAYGAGVVGSSPEENNALMMPLLEDRAELLGRLRAGIAAGSAHAAVDSSKSAAIGYCFGGLCALDLARSGDNLNGVVSLHGLFTPPPQTADKYLAKVLVLHGWDDPMAKPESVLEVSKELTHADCDWQLHAYGQTMHSFTNPAADDAASGILYQADAARRSWQAMANFLGELF
ncbi:MAG: dienelactone hydrolase family protein [Gammaproteobacteria bacterium]